MAYCPSCGAKNVDNAKFCIMCGASMMAAPRAREKEWEDRCEKECAGGPRRASIFWAIIIILIGLWIVWEFGIRNIQGLPPELTNFQFWWIFPIIIGLVIIITGISMVTRGRRTQ